MAVTGAGSFLGRNLIGVLEEDPTVSRIVVLDVETPKNLGRKSRAYRVDLTQPTVGARLAEILQAERATELAHLAFLSSPSNATAWAHEVESVGTMHVMRACREAGIERVVVRSDTALYGAHPSNPNFLVESAPLRGLRETSYLADKIEAEAEVERFAKERPQSSVAILRFAPIVGPTVRTWVTRWLAQRLVPTCLGYDPLVQFVHEMDAVAVLVRALRLREARGVFNIVGEGVLPISMVVRLAGRRSVPLPGPLLRRLALVGWIAGVTSAPASFTSFLRHLCVADGARAKRELGFRAAFTTRDAVLDFGETLRLREARLITEARS